MTITETKMDGRRLRRAGNRERIYEAAMLLLEDSSFDAVSIDDVFPFVLPGTVTSYKFNTGLLVQPAINNIKTTISILFIVFL